ncbi:MAG: DUF4249 domain-containing protein [Bacteroidetes bacterium]|nr:DUF4249 domain-containing protein [Bacteroidota bacterium]
MNRYIKLIALSLTLGFSACEKDADVELPAVESKLVISSFISPEDTIVKVGVTISQPLYNNSNSNQYSAVSYATVQITNGTTVQTLAYNADENYYFVSTAIFPITVGTTYNLTVSTPDGKNANASTSIPAQNSTLTYTAEAVNNQSNGDTYAFRTEWNDTPGTEDYYRLVYYDRSVYDIDTTYWQAFSNNFSDKDKDGTTMKEQFEIYAYSGTGFSNGELHLIHASKEYYLYHKKLTEAAFSGGPFSEPVQMYSNINGGYGAFAGYNSYKLYVSL